MTVFVFPSNCRYDGALLPWVRVNTCLLLGSSEGIPPFDLLGFTALALPLKLSLKCSILTFTLPVLSLILPWGQRASSCVVLSYLLYFDHNSWHQNIGKYTTQLNKQVRTAGEGYHLPVQMPSEVKIRNGMMYCCKMSKGRTVNLRKSCQMF